MIVIPLDALLALVAKVLGHDGVHPDSNWVEMGMDSLAMAELAAELVEIGIPLDLDEIWACESIDALHAILIRRSSEPFTSP